MEKGIFKLNTISKSELGTRAAWKGFSSQTVYIAYRLMILDDEFDFFPEQAEDLMITKDGKISELVQVKNLSADLALSHLSPKETDSFFQRCLQQKSQSNEDIVLRLISFGPIGEEIRTFCTNEFSPELSVSKKLLSYGYSDAEVEWIHSHLNVDQVVEKKLLSDIYHLLESRVRTMAAPHVAFDVLINYISNLSRAGTHTSKQIWEQKLDSIAIDLTAASALAKQFGQTIFPIYEYKDVYDYETLETEYNAGINALPQHIRANLDLPRKRWNSIIEDELLTSNIVVIRGASGQGKSTIAYRYLLDHYLECNIICIEKVFSENQAIEICAALQGIAKERRSALAVYMDVTPYDISWLWICEQLQAHGTELKLIITIREEDFRRISIDYSKHRFAEVELHLSEEEAKEIYNRYPTAAFLTFDEAWKSFGENGPFMEFAYMLHQSGTIRDRLKAQIDRITQQEEYADDWLQILEVVSYVGKYNLDVNTSLLFEKLPCPQRRKMLSVFEKEYFLRESEDRVHLESLHALRATILFDILKENSILTEFDNLKLALQIIEDVPLMLVVEFFQRNKISSDIVRTLATIKYNSWSVYAGVLKAVVWAEVYSYYWQNKSIIDKGNTLINNFIMFGITDITGYLKGIDLTVFWDVLKNQNLDKYQSIQDLILTLDTKTLSYEYLDVFIVESSSNLPFNITMRAEDLTSMGFSLFWFSKRKHILPEHNFERFLPSMNFTNLEDYLNLLVGLSYQNWSDNYERLKLLAQAILFPQLGIVYCDVSEEVTVFFIYDIYDIANTDYNSRILRIVDVVRMLYPQKQKYNVEMIGHDIIDNIDLPDTRKHIPSENIPFFWITQLNSWLHNIDEYVKAPATWDNVHEEIVRIRTDIIYSVDLILRGVDYLYNKQSSKRLIETSTLDSINEVREKLSGYSLTIPKCALDKYGIRLNNTIVDTDKGNMQLASSPIRDNKEKHFKSLWNNFCNSYLSFLNQKDSLLVARIKKQKVPNEGRLSLINLISAYQGIDDLQVRYQAKLSKYGSQLFSSEDRSRLLLLVATWSYVFSHPLQKTSSLTYDSKLYLRRYGERLENFFYNEIFLYEGVLKGNKNDKTVHILVNAEQVELLCRKIFLRFKQKFPEVSTLTLEETVVKDYIQHIEIIVCLNGQPLPGGYLIKIENLVVYEEVEKFMSMLMPSSNTHGIELEDSPKTAALKIFADLHAMPMLFKHIAQVNSKVATFNTNESYFASAYESWISDTKGYLVKILYEIEFSINLIKNYRPMTDEPDVIEYTDIVLNMLRELKNNSIVLLTADATDEVQEIIETLENGITTLIDLHPMEYFQ